MFNEFYLDEKNPVCAALTAQFLHHKFGAPPYPKSMFKSMGQDVSCLILAQSDIYAAAHGIVSCPGDVPWWPTGLIGEFFHRVSDFIYPEKSRPKVLLEALDEIPRLTPFWKGFNEFRFVAFFACWVRCDCPIADLTRGPEHVTVSTVLSAMCRRYISDKCSDQMLDLFEYLSDNGCRQDDTADHAARQDDTADHAARQDDTADHAARQDDTASKLALGMTPDQPAGQADQRVRPFGSSARDDHPAMDRDELLTAMGSVQDHIEYYQERIRNMNTRQEEIHPIKEKIDQLYREHSHYREILQSLGKADGPPAA